MYEASKEVTTGLLMANMQNEELQRDLAINFANLGDIENAQNNHRKAEELYGVAKDMFITLSAKNPLNQQLKDDVENIERRLASLHIKQ